MESKTIHHVATGKLKCEPQPRTTKDVEAMAGLAQTIRETGILQPLLVRRDGDDLIVVEGHRRLEAAIAVGLPTVPVIIDDHELAESEVVYRQLITNCQRADLTPMETARGVDRLMELSGWSAAQVAVKLGMSPGKVSKLLALLELPEVVQLQVEQGALPLTTAYALTQAPNAESQRMLAVEASSGGLTRDEVAKRAKASKAGRRESTPRERKRAARTTVKIPFGGGRTVSVAGPELTLGSMIDWLADILERLRVAHGDGVELQDAVKRVSAVAP